MTRRRRGRLVRAALRLGTLTMLAGAAWCAYDVATTEPAHAAEEPPATTAHVPVDRVTDLVRVVLSPVLTDAGVAEQRSGAPDPVRSRPPRPAPPPPAGQPPGTNPPAAETSPPNTPDESGRDRLLRAPILDPLAPVLDILDPVVSLPQPVPSTPLDPVPQPAPEPTAPPATPIDTAAPAEPVAVDRLPHAAAWSGAVAAPAGPGQRSGARSHADGSTVDGTADDPVRPVERIPGKVPVPPAPGTSGAESAPISHGGIAVIGPAGWAPPQSRGRVTRPVRSRRRPSRSPRPRSRPA